MRNVIRAILYGAVLALAVTSGLKLGNVIFTLQERVERLEQMIGLLDSRDRYSNACDIAGLTEGDLVPSIWWNVKEEEAECHVYPNSDAGNGVIVLEELELIEINKQFFLNLKGNRSL